jgi:hypothetical protein
MPYFFRNSIYTSPQKDKLVFGFLGVASEKKGSLEFVKIAKYIKQQKNKLQCQFRLIGHVTDSRIKISELTNFIYLSSNSNKPLNIVTFLNDSNSINYSVFCFPINSYQLSCSATFYDALSLIKPIIALKNSFFDFYFNELGDIGYLCETIEDIELLILNLLENFDKDRYENQCRNILLSREKLGLVETSKQINNILNFNN